MNMVYRLLHNDASVCTGLYIHAHVRFVKTNKNSTWYTLRLCARVCMCVCDDWCTDKYVNLHSVKQCKK